MPAARIGRPDSVASSIVARRNWIRSISDVEVPTRIPSRRVATKPEWITRRTYWPDGSGWSTKRPRLSVCVTTDVMPNADTIAPGSGPPRSSTTTPWMLPSMRCACCWTGLKGAWADADAAVNPRIAAAATNPVRRAMLPPVILLGRHREIDVLRQDLRALLVRDLHFQPVRTLGEALERNPLPGLDAAAGSGRIEAGSHRLVGEQLRLGAVEPLLAACLLTVERVGRLEAELLLGRQVRVVDLEEDDQLLRLLELLLR